MRAALVSGAIVAANAALLAVGWWMLASPVDTTPLVSARSKGDLLEKTGAKRDAGKALDFSDVKIAQAFARPLFAKDRRPWEPPPPPPPPPQKKVAVRKDPEPEPVRPPEFRLVGVTMADGVPTRALLNMGPQRMVWATEGQSLGPWVVAKIGPQSMELVVEGGTQTHSLFLYPDLADAQ